MCADLVEIQQGPHDEIFPPVPWRPFCYYSLPNANQALIKRSPTLGLSSGVKEPGPFTTEMRSGGSTAVTEVSSRHRVASSATASERGGRGGGSTSTGYASEGRAGEDERMKKRSLCWQVEGCRAELTAQVVSDLIFLFITLSLFCFFIYPPIHSEIF